MKISLVFFGIVLSLLLAGCGARPYVDVASKDYATLQLVPKSETMIFTDDFYVFIDDFSKGCDDIGKMGIVKTDSDTNSRVVKISLCASVLIIK